MSGLAASWVGRKKQTLRASEQDRPDVAAERDISGRDSAMIDPSRRVFMDETGILTNMTRRFARAVIGDRACGSAPANGTRLTVLGALSCDGMVGVMTVPNGTTAVVFVDVLKTTVLPFWQEHKPDGLLVRDNLSAHQNKAVKPAIEDAGLTLHYLPR
jgi:hypothetical protein